MMVMNAVEISEQASHSPLIADVLDYVDSHVGDSMSLDTLARQFYISSYHLAHKFKDEVGCTVNQYILNRKLGEIVAFISFLEAGSFDAWCSQLFESIDTFRFYLKHRNYRDHLRPLSYYRSLQSRNASLIASAASLCPLASPMTLHSTPASFRGASSGLNGCDDCICQPLLCSCSVIVTVVSYHRSNYHSVFEFHAVDRNRAEHMI